MKYLLWEGLISLKPMPAVFTDVELEKFYLLCVIQNWKFVLKLLIVEIISVVMV